MKKVICGALCCLLLLGGCAKEGGETAFEPERTVQALLDSGAYSEQLEELDPTLLFQLEGEGSDYAGSVLYYSTGATAEAAAVIVAPDEERAQAVEQTLQTWVEGQTEAERGYRPAEAEKLEHAVLERRGNTVLLAVCADWEKARAAIPAE